MKHHFYLQMLLVSTSLLFCAFTAYAQVGVQWDKTFGALDNDILASSIPAHDGGYLLAGSSDSRLSYEKSEHPRNRSYDYWIVKTDANGNKQWDKIFGGTRTDMLQTAIATTDGGYLLAGNSDSKATADKSEDRRGGCDQFGNCDSDYWVVKIDAEGNKLWDKTFGGSRNEEIKKILETEDGGYLLAGNSQSNASGDKSENRRGSCNQFGNCEEDYWIVKIDANGNKQWDKTIGGSNRDRLQSAIATADGGYLLGGSSFSDALGDKSESRVGSSDYWIVKVDADGNKEWDKTFGGTSRDGLSEVILASDQGFLVVGNSESPASGDKTDNTRNGYDCWLIKVDEHGNKIWDKTISSGSIRKVITTSDGGYLLAAWASGSNSYISGFDYQIVKIDVNGNKIWDETVGGRERDELMDIVTISDGDYLLAGTSESPASGDKSGDSRGGKDYWIVKVEVKTFYIKELSLVNANTDEHITNFGTISLSRIGNPPLSIRAHTEPITVDSVKLELSGPVSHTQTERHYPYALYGDDPKAGDTGRDYAGRYWQEGRYTVTATPYLGGQAGVPFTNSFSVTNDLVVSNFILVNADTDEDITELTDRDVIDLSALGNPHLTVRIIIQRPEYGVFQPQDSFKFELTGPVSHTQMERYIPFVLFGDEPKAGDTGRDYVGMRLKPGTYTLSVTPFLNGEAGVALVASFSVIGDNSNSNARMAVEVYPVPTKGEITITHEGTAEEAQMMLLDYAGNVVLEQPLSRQDQQLDLSSFRKGFYYLKIASKEAVEVKRILLE